MDDGAKVFVKIDSYKDVLAVIDEVKGKLAEAKANLSKINQFRSDEEQDLQEWSASLADIEQRIGDIDTKLQEPSA
ncbi:TPA: hypothetical protein HA361_05455 [Candidatus Woesearchaeota archaeon]|nr:hypothetical protein [Candidatus Woesearchaeota archaeon]HII68305.1 hypothetical protein [Candidatus Woesearchaeota archaeon]